MNFNDKKTTLNGEIVQGDKKEFEQAEFIKNFLENADADASQAREEAKKLLAREEEKDNTTATMGISDISIDGMIEEEEFEASLSQFDDDVNEENNVNEENEEAFSQPQPQEKNSDALLAEAIFEKEEKEREVQKVLMEKEELKMKMKDLEDKIEEQSKIVSQELLNERDICIEEKKILQEKMEKIEKEVKMLQVEVEEASKRKEAKEENSYKPYATPVPKDLEEEETATKEANPYPQTTPLEEKEEEEHIDKEEEEELVPLEEFVPLNTQTQEQEGEGEGETEQKSTKEKMSIAKKGLIGIGGVVSILAILVAYQSFSNPTASPMKQLEEVSDTNKINPLPQKEKRPDPYPTIEDEDTLIDATAITNENEEDIKIKPKAKKTEKITKKPTEKAYICTLDPQYEEGEYVYYTKNKEGNYSLVKDNDGFLFKKKMRIYAFSSKSKYIHLVQGENKYMKRKIFSRCQLEKK